jgi:hypothetical protein
MCVDQLDVMRSYEAGDPHGTWNVERVSQ